MKDQSLIKDLNAIFLYVTNLNFSDNTIEEKIKRSTNEIMKVATGSSQDKIPFLVDCTP